MDLAAYLRRIDAPSLEGQPADLALLRELTRAHVTHIPFENLDVQLEHPISLELAALEDKLVARRRGGYCFEHCTLLASVLRAMGFSVSMLAARVLWNMKGATPRTHTLLQVPLEDTTYIVDVGFGGFVPLEPLHLGRRVHEGSLRVQVDESKQVQPLGVFSYRRTGDFIELYAHMGSEPALLYRFTEEPGEPIDFEVMNHFTSTHPASRFRRNLMVARPSLRARHSLAARTEGGVFECEYVVRHGDGRVDRQTLTVDELPKVLADVFELVVDDPRALLALRS